MFKGVGKGIGGVFLKPPAGMPHNYVLSTQPSHCANLTTFISFVGTGWLSSDRPTPKATEITRQKPRMSDHLISHRARTRRHAGIHT